MRTIVFIGSQKSGSSREAIRAAKSLGYQTVLLTNNEKFLKDSSEFPDVDLMEFSKLSDIDHLRKSILELKRTGAEICSIVSFIDAGVYNASKLADELGINRFSKDAIFNMIDKVRSREILSNTEFGPVFTVLPNSCLDGSCVNEILQRFPMIMKSPRSNASRDVIQINNQREFEKYVGLLSSKFPATPILLEEFLDGPQYLVEVVMFKGEVRIIAVIEQEIEHKTRFIVIGYNLLLDLPEDFTKSLTQAVECIVKTHAMETGGCHLEMRLVKGKWKLIEINPRISGAGMNRLIEEAYGVNLVRETIKMSLGEEPILTPQWKKHVYAKYVTVSSTGILEKASGKRRARESTGVRYVHVIPRKGARLVPPSAMGHRYAYVIAEGDSEMQAKNNAIRAASYIKFKIRKEK